MGGARNKIKKVLKTIFRVRTWKLFLILVPMLFLTATLLRLDHLGMVALRDRVIEADEKGEGEELMRALRELQEYTVSHIVVNMVEENGVERVVFGTGPFYLEQQYIRKAKEELAKAEASLLGSGENPHGNVFKKAAAVCDARAIQFGWGFNKAYVDCMTSELARYPEMGEIESFRKAMIPPTALYRRDFASPIMMWSWSGVAILGCGLLGVVILIRCVIWVALRIVLFLLKKR